MSSFSPTAWGAGFWKDMIDKPHAPASAGSSPLTPEGLQPIATLAVPQPKLSPKPEPPVEK